MNRIVLFDPSLATDNGGDSIILDYCVDILREMFPSDYFVHLSTQERLSTVSRSYAKRCKNQFVCGTNLLSSHLGPWRQWRINWWDTRYFKDICLMGVGWWQYEDKNPSLYAKNVYKRALSHTLIHSVRDSYTEKKLREMGFDNVVNTSCPTMWRLTPDFCEKIPQNKAKSVVTTVTCYHQNPILDKVLLDILFEEYEQVYLWIQTIDDYTYLKQFYDVTRFQIIYPNVASLDQILEKDVDYCGTRLHAGIRALNHQKRTIIVANDNRAIEISKDTGLPIVSLGDIEKKLANMLNQKMKTELQLPYENINRWKAQFK